MGIAAVLTLASYAWSFFGIRMFLGSSIEDYIRIQIALSATEFLALHVGLFLVFAGVLGLLPRSHPWSRVGPLLILVGALIVAGFGVAEWFLVYSGTSTTPGSLLEALFLVLLAVDIAGYVATAVGLILSLFAVVLGVLARRPPASNAPPA